MTCIMYISHLWIFFGALVSSHALDRRNRGCTEVKISASLKSEVFLPCHFNESFGNETETVKWSNTSRGVTLLTIMENGRIIFESPTEGRVKIFPLLFRDGNFSILIRDLEPSDIGPYFCELRNECWRVEIIERLIERRRDELNPWFYFAAGAGLFILLFISFSLFSKFYGKHTNNSSKSNPVSGVRTEGNNHPEETRNTERSEQRNKNNRGLRRGFTTVYENDAHAPNQSSSVQQGQHPQRAFRAAPVPEPTARHPSDLKPYYVNQAELSNPGNAGKKRKRRKHFQFKNPIYGDCVD
ncbi:uncharacterized protein LOC127496114 [Ctenopharyngodon idella]|uniref:uncharacterized protein LOC127496114 n=1 Tax=Ctenopharyngodon idella TaxID=7959 RepID=UPI00222FBD09|nr:uncharacterized protein LOC127496114 [Ctenopharyngodon idella]XP_051719710.1 uncharacterized protein LOC127496114 [Ctenopharyngodon idella]